MVDVPWCKKASILAAMSPCTGLHTTEGIPTFLVHEAILKLKQDYKGRLARLQQEEVQSYITSEQSLENISIESQILNDFQMVDTLPQGRFEEEVLFPNEIEIYLKNALTYSNGEKVEDYWIVSFYCIINVGIIS